ncbi:MAG: AtpZ/AtpI family protein [Kofleriaceae bacterium]
MSQDSAPPTLHRSVVKPGESLHHSVAPSARGGRRAFDYLSNSSVGLELGISVVIGLLFGYWLDQKLGTQPWMMLLFLVFGLVAGLRGVIRAVNRADRAAARDAREAEAEAARG